MVPRDNNAYQQPQAVDGQDENLADVNALFSPATSAGWLYV